ncbi:DUF397 domain-containing protein [Streptosporangium sp. NBC_01639]|uniref:DUF397 domain-containing protein n=1 Tax=Streptosporangium sp. NBC_01639 TaxID=2975948 RepID=UPI00386C85DE|nr:DUF397 domain-containing protein [Streptosporangium sp. NBC_01639]
MDLSDARWVKASFSGDNGGNCVEVAELTEVGDGPGHKADYPELIAVRDSKDPDGPKLFFTSAEWDAFLNGAKAGEFDRH